MEKAWSKLYGSYYQIEAGLTREALHDLTGAPCITLFIENGSNDHVWAMIKKGEQRDFIMTSGTLDSDQAYGGASVLPLSKAGLATGHAYSLLAGHELNFKGSNVKLVQLRNPWGQSEWSGKWNDEDQRWNSVSADEKRKIGFGGPKNDGIFFMEFEDFVHYFDACQFCYCHDNFKYSSLSIDSSSGEGKYIKVNLPQTGQYYFTVSQRSVRHLPEREQEDHR